MPEPEFINAWAKAEMVARESWRFFAAEGLETYLQDFYIESGHCWVFYRHLIIVLPPDAVLSDWAICVGEIETRLIANLSAEPDLAQRYADLMSHHFKGENNLKPEIIQIFDEFNRRQQK